MEKQGKSCSVRFRIGKQECDTVDDLKDIGGTTSNFEMLFVLAVLGYFRDSVVCLRYSHEGGVLKWFDRHTSEIIIGVIGAAIGVLFTKLADHWWK
jgi:hypothetical protein